MEYIIAFTLIGFAALLGIGSLCAYGNEPVSKQYKPYYQRPPYVVHKAEKGEAPEPINVTDEDEHK